MTETELKAVLKRHGWYLAYETRRSQGKRFVYARRRRGDRMVKRYIAAESKLDELTEDEVVKRIQR